MRKLNQKNSISGISETVNIRKEAQKEATLNAFMPSWVWARLSRFFCRADSDSSLNLRQTHIDKNLQEVEYTV